MSPHLHTTSTQDYCQHYDMADDASVLDVHSTQQQYEKLGRREAKKKALTIIMAIYAKHTAKCKFLLYN